VWLPDAMAGPTPVSALIHAATMVTAGIYMMTRSHALFEYAPTTQTVVAIIGALTAFVAGTSALRQYDIKKVLAYSTVSQLGFMVAAAGIGAYVASHFHLLTHAFFKALLFLAAGAVIHGMEHYRHSLHGKGHVHQDDEHRTEDEPVSSVQHTSPFDPQDMRNMGGLTRKMPVTFVTFLIGALALAGVPPLSGFFSKDEIMAWALEKNLIVFVILSVTALITAIYVGRQIMLVFIGKPRTEDAQHAVESPLLMTIPLAILAVLAAVGGIINLPAEGGGWLHHWLEPVLAEAAKPFNIVIAGVFTVVAVVGLAIGFARYSIPDRARHEADAGLGNFLFRAWRFDDLYRAIIIKPFYAISTICAQVLDVGIIDGIVNGVGRLTRNVAGSLRGIQTGFVRNYGLVMLMGVVVVVAYFILNAR
jgi:NADH-quinone oxidoreductase subunit L